MYTDSSSCAQDCPVCPKTYPSWGTNTASSKADFVPWNPCFMGHDYFETKDGNTIICRRCGTAKAILLP